MKARLIFPDPTASQGPNNVNWEDCEYSKCGRTDKGVSAFGQVIGIRVRSNRPLPSKEVELGQIINPSRSRSPTNQRAALNDPDAISTSNKAQIQFDDIADEIAYPQILNRLLPPDIRILAWCPQPPLEFSARFSCRERQYRYFFTQPAFCPDPTSPTLDGSRREGWLDIEAMRTAAKKFEGLHDFQNFCKVDPGKQIADFSRRIFYSDIVEVKDEDQAAAFVHQKGFDEFPNGEHISNGIHHEQASVIRPPKIYMFVLHGSAFLWHQVRCMVAMLFLIGQGLESPSLVSKLLDTNSTSSKPHYDMAEDVPLVLWDCIFPDGNSDSREDSLKWVYVSDQSETTEAAIVPTGSKKGGKYGFGGLVQNLWRVWRTRKMDEILAGSLLNAVVGQGPNLAIPENVKKREPPQSKTTQEIYFGGDSPERKGAYVEILKRRRMESVEVQNQRYAERKGIPPTMHRDLEDSRGDHQRDIEP